MPQKHISAKVAVIILILLVSKANILFSQTATVVQQTGIHDTILTAAVVYNGDTIEAKTLVPVFLYTHLRPGMMSANARWTRLRNAVYVTYPYAVRAGLVLNEMTARLNQIHDNDGRKEYIRSKEKDLKREFTDPLTNLSIYQGKILMKLINRETGNNCYNIIKDYKGGFTARFYQTVAFFFGSNLKQPYDPGGDDADIEKIVMEVRRMYGMKS
jgi:hypothetical protein